MNKVRHFVWIPVLFLTAGTLHAQAVPSNTGPSAATMPRALQNVGFEPPLNGPMPLDLSFRDETGRSVQLRDYFGQQKPVVLAFVYYGCPMLCDQVEQGVVGVLRMLSFNPGRDYEVVFVSFDSRETPEMAAEKKKKARTHFRRPEIDSENYSPRRCAYDSLPRRRYFDFPSPRIAGGSQEFASAACRRPGKRSSLTRAAAITDLSGASVQLCAAGGRADAFHHWDLCVLCRCHYHCHCLFLLQVPSQGFERRRHCHPRRFAARGPVCGRSHTFGPGHVRVGRGCLCGLSQHAARHARRLRDRQAVDVEGPTTQRIERNP